MAYRYFTLILINRETLVQISHHRSNRTKNILSNLWTTFGCTRRAYHRAHFWKVKVIWQLVNRYNIVRPAARFRTIEFPGVCVARCWVRGEKEEQLDGLCDTPTDVQRCCPHTRRGMCLRCSKLYNNNLSSGAGWHRRSLPLAPCQVSSLQY